MKKLENKELNLGEWGIVDGPMMRDILDCFILRSEFEDKVLELQRIQSLFTSPGIRFFIGQKIKMTDYREWNSEELKKLELLNDMAKMANVNEEERRIDFVDSVCAMCMWEAGPRITPLLCKGFSGQYVTNKMFHDIFGKSILREGEKYRKSSEEERKDGNSTLGLWLHETDEGKYELPTLRGSKYEPKFRIRIMDFKVWKTITDEYIKMGCVCPDYIMKDDIKEELIDPSTFIANIKNV